MPRENAVPAFPPNAGWRDDDPEARGMSLRDYFAAAALAGVIQNNRSALSNAELCGRIAASCYEMADAMLEARRG